LNCRQHRGFEERRALPNARSVVDVICRGLAGAADVKLMGMGVERGVLGVDRGVLGVSRVFNIIRSIDFVRNIRSSAVA
jgi:hypothetical protein